KDIKVKGQDKNYLQQKLVVYQLMQRRLEELQQQAMLIERKYKELETTKQTLGDMKKLKKTDEVFFPLGNGVYAKGNVSNDKKLFVELGAGLVTNKTPETATKFIEGKEKEMEKSAKEVQTEIEDTISKLNGIGEELRAASGQQ
ncbi:MAG: prefoldin subunit alpha, partial [Candidatus Aenigmatarchaeota archaeon]